MEEVWLNIKNGDKDAYSQMYVSYYRKFFNYGKKFTDNIPLLEDAIQEVLLSIWANRENLHIIQIPNTYYFTAFRNNLFRKLKEETIDLQPVEYEFSIDAILIKQEMDNELSQKLHAAIKLLTPRQREAIYLRFYEGLSYEEVAAMLDISVKATYKIMARSLLHLKQVLHISLVSLLFLLRISLIIRFIG